MDTRSIGIFDSGLGGISVLREIVGLMPNENYIYYGDSANAPYGTRTAEDILALSKGCTGFLLEHNVKAIVIACNTATSVAASHLRRQYPNIPIIGIEPALKPAVLWKEHDRVAVMATPATLSLPKFCQLMKQYSRDSVIYPVPCPGLMEYVEKGILEGAELEDFIHGLLDPYLARNIDAIVLGCTHYPFVQDTIQKVAGAGVKLFSGSHGTALELRRRLMAADLLTPSKEHGDVTFHNSNKKADTLKLCQLLFDM